MLYFTEKRIEALNYEKGMFPMIGTIVNHKSIYRFFKKKVMDNWIFYLTGLCFILGSKYLYSRAGADELQCFLAPTARWVELLSGQPFERMAGIGYVNHHLRFIIAPSCSGMQFMLIAFATLLYSFIHRVKTTKRQICWMGLSFAVSYFYTIFINGIRIVLSIYLKDADIYGDWLTQDRLHTMLGIAIYFTSLLILYRIVEYFWGKLSCLNLIHPLAFICPAKKRYAGISKYILPAFWYFFITLGIPFLNGAYKNSDGKFAEYAAVVIFMCMAIVLLLGLTAYIKRCRQ